MSARIHRSRVALLLAVGLSLTLVACTPPGVDLTPTTPPAAEATPTPTPSEEAASAPEPVIDVSCAEMLPPSTVAAAFGDPLSIADAAHSTMAAGAAIVPAYVARSLGGLACEWNNGQTYSGSRGANPDYSGVRVVVLPDAGAQWDRYVEYYGTDGLGLFCGAAVAPYPLGCESNDLVGSHWVETTIFDATSEAAAATLHSAILAAVGAAGPGAAAWTAPADTLALPSNCESLAPLSAVQSALGVASPVVAVGAAGGWSLPAGADVIAAVVSCSWLYSDADAGVGAFRALPAGSWAWAEALPVLALPSTPEALGLTGLESDEEAWIRCAAGNSECVVDLVIGGNWLEFELWPEDGFGRVTADRRAAAGAIAQAIVDGLRP